MSEVVTSPPHDLGIPHRLVASNTHLKHKPSKWGYLEYDHMYHKFVGGGVLLTWVIMREIKLGSSFLEARRQLQRRLS